jgi:hypothetical protein
MVTVVNWILESQTERGITMPDLPPDEQNRLRTPSPALDGIFILKSGFSYFDNVPIGLASPDTRETNPKLKWISANTESGNLLIFFLLLQSATANLDSAILDPLPYLRSFQLQGVTFTSC